MAVIQVIISRNACKKTCLCAAWIEQEGTLVCGTTAWVDQNESAEPGLTKKVDQGLPCPVSAEPGLTKKGFAVSRVLV